MALSFFWSMIGFAVEHVEAIEGSLPKQEFTEEEHLKFQSLPSPNGVFWKESYVYSYVGAGFSTFVIIPYSANLSIGARKARPDNAVGWDISLNYTTSYISQYTFAKVMAPIYANSQEPISSYYFAPYLCLGYNTSQVNVHDFDFNKGRYSSALLVTGMAIGKNFKVGDKLGFSQLGINIRRFDIMDARAKSSAWPTLTYQYGIGF